MMVGLAASFALFAALQPTADNILAATASDPAPTKESLVEKGERHAGNNFFQAVLKYNMPNVTDHATCDTESADSQHFYCCWTHGYASDTCANAFVPPLTAMILVVRNPYSWLAAMHVDPYEHDGPVPANMSQFLRQEFSYTPQQYPGVSDSKASAVALWNAKVDSYLELNRTRHVVITHDELYDADALTEKLRPLTQSGGFYPPGSGERMSFDAILDAVTNDKMSGEFSRSAFDSARRYEQARSWLSYFTDDDLAFINAAVGEERMRRFGFETLHSVAGETRGQLFQTTARRALGMLDHVRWRRMMR